MLGDAAVGYPRTVVSSSTGLATVWLPTTQHPGFAYRDVHDMPTISSEDRQHDLSRHCWCQPVLYQMWTSMRPQQGLVVKHKSSDD